MNKNYTKLKTDIRDYLEKNLVNLGRLHFETDVKPNTVYSSVELEMSVFNRAITVNQCLLIQEGLYTLIRKFLKDGHYKVYYSGPNDELSIHKIIIV